MGVSEMRIGIVVCREGDPDRAALTIVPLPPGRITISVGLGSMRLTPAEARAIRRGLSRAIRLAEEPAP